jgi:hypothetical protein
MSMFQNAGSQLFTADGAVSSSGKPVRIYMIHVVSTGGGGAVINLRNGTSASDTAWITETGTTSKGVTFSYGGCGILFPNGCFVDVDSNTTSVAVSFERADA